MQGPRLIDGHFMLAIPLELVEYFRGADYVVWQEDSTHSGCRLVAYDFLKENEHDQISGGVP